MLDRYNIVNEADIREAARRLDDAFGSPARDEQRSTGSSTGSLRHRRAERLKRRRKEFGAVFGFAFLCRVYGARALMTVRG
jgi:hypothetical protein